MNTNHRFSVSEMFAPSVCPRRIAMIVVGLLLCSTALHADFELFTSRASFNAAAPNLPIETFDNLSLPIDNFGADLVGDAVDSMTSAGPIQPGDILPGVRVTSTTPLVPESILLVNAFAGYPTDTNVIGPLDDPDELVLLFSPAVSAVGFDMWGLIGEGNPGESRLDAVFYQDQFVVGTLTTDADYTGRFIGGVATNGDSITHVVLENQADALGGNNLGEFIDNLTFGEPDMSGSGLVCDFDGDTDCDSTDLDVLYDNFGNNGTFDLNGDGTVEGGDIGAFLAAASNPANPFNASGHTFVVGDVDLSGGVNSVDLGLLLNNFGDTDGKKFGAGNLNDDANINSVDLGLLLNNFNFGAAATAVPEPAAAPWMLLIGGGLAMAASRRRS